MGEHPRAGPLPSTSSVERATMISLPGSKSASSPGHASLITGTPQAAASKRRTLGEWPASIMSLRVTLSVKRCAQ